MIDNFKIQPFQKALVVMSPDAYDPIQPMLSPLVQRALHIASRTGAELEFFQVCHDPALDWALLKDDAEVREAKRRMLDDNAAVLAEALVHMEAGTIQTSYDVRWHKDRAAAVIAKAEETGADLIIKLSRSHRYIFGLSNNTDWSLIRKSQIPVWFVQDKIQRPLRRIMAAVGSSDSADILDSSDYATLQLATSLAASAQTELWTTHCFQVPRNLPFYSGYAPTVSAARAYENIYNLREKVARDVERTHSQTLQDMAERFSLARERIIIKEGPPATQIPATAADINVDLVLMGAGETSLVNRILSDNHAEPVLADAECDVLFVADRESAVKDAGEDLRSFRFDLEQAIIDPAGAFNNPRQVVELPEISDRLRRRILLAWRHDVHIQMTDVTEGADMSEPHAATLLQDINAALDHLEIHAPSRRSA